MATTLTATFQNSWLADVQMKQVLYLITINTYSEVGPFMSLSTHLPSYVYGMAVLGDRAGYFVDYVHGSENGPDLGHITVRGWITSTTDLTVGGYASVNDYSSIINFYAMFYGY